MLFRYSLLLLFILLLDSELQGQTHRSVHQEHQAYYNSLGIQKEAAWDSLHGIEPIPSGSRGNCSLQKVVYGWHPYWMGSAYQNYDWDLLSHFSYFSYEVDPSTGYPDTTYNWLSSGAVTEAQNNGVKADLCVTLFQDHSTFLNSSTARQNLIDTLISLVQARNANGVNIDFENVPSSESTAYNNFLVDLATQMHNQVPGSEVSVALFAVDWNNIFDASLLDQYLDYFVIMGYGYHYSGSSTAGPTAPLYDFGSGTRNLSRTVNQYLKEGISRSKLVLGLPYYGYEWETASDQIPENTTSTGTSKTYTTIRDNASGHYSNTNKGWHFESRSQHFVFQDNGNWYQCFTELARGLDERYDLIHQRDLAGMGIWALGYDDGYQALWKEIERHFTDCRSVPCRDTIYDMGGPDGEYYNDESYAYTIDPDGAGRVNLDFKSFDIEYGYDSLWIHDGADTTAPLIGGYTGTSGPGTIVSSGKQLTIAFESDGATTAPGWQAVWTCIEDSLAPGTAIHSLPDWVTGDFSVTFSDTDDTQGSGVKSSYYQVLQKDSTEWRGNQQSGFFHDAFEQNSIHPDWKIDTGTWQLSNGMLHQSDESLSNTNIHASLQQEASDRFLYHWKAEMSGSGANRRAGLHYFCDSAELSNRGNSYFVWFRLDDDRIQLYKSVNNSWGSGPVHEIPYPFQDGQLYDFKLSFDRINGTTKVYVDNELELQWTDPSPHASGNAVSFRSGNADLKVAAFDVYRSRSSSEVVEVGPGSKEPLRYQSRGAGRWAGHIASIVQDSAGNLSPIDRDSIKIDTTKPILSTLQDGHQTQDRDTVKNPNGTLKAEWDSAQDPHSGIDRYSYAIGEQPGDSNIVTWSSVMTDTSVTRSGLSLESDSSYYFALRAWNRAGLKSEGSSDGILVLKSSSLEETKLEKPKIFPSPFQERFHVRWERNPEIDELLLLDGSGRRVPAKMQWRGSKELLIHPKVEDSQGIHFLWIRTREGRDRVYQVMRR